MDVTRDLDGRFTQAPRPAWHAHMDHLDVDLPGEDCEDCRPMEMSPEAAVRRFWDHKRAATAAASNWTCAECRHGDHDDCGDGIGGYRCSCDFASHSDITATVLHAAVEQLVSDAADDDPGEATEPYVSRCPVCSDPIDYCQGHGEIGDPAGFAILASHDAGYHDDCHPEGCDEAPRHLARLAIGSEMGGPR
jgi:hypothetical protein